LEDESWQPPAGDEADPERIAVGAERSRVLNEAMTRITDDQRTAIVLYDVEGYDYGEIAEMTGVSLGTVKSRIHRGRLALRGLLEDRMDLFRG
jgi:RNA polymerase sigma-70 factor (ECF subfamily)